GFHVVTGEIEHSAQHADGGSNVEMHGSWFLLAGCGKTLWAAFSIPVKRISLSRETCETFEKRGTGEMDDG
ncbi:MAG: hypothetical protein ABI955_08100, partial [Nitrospirota bacterium]